MPDSLHVRLLEPGLHAAWQAFLASSGNGTLFHDLDFLAYHPPNRFRAHHLIVQSGTDVVALVPGGLIEAPDGLVWRSPVGASIGGPVLGARARLSDAHSVIDALQQHARAEGWKGLEVTIPPSSYHPQLGDLVGFALFRCGFREAHRWLCPMIDLGVVPSTIATADALFEKRQVQALRAAVRKGAVANEAGIEALGEFGTIFADTYARHGTNPTHSSSEIEDLMRRFPDRIRVVLARQGDAVTGGLLVMHLTPSVATTFYICSAAEHIQASGPIVAIAGLLEGLRRRGCRWLDLGPSASDTALNAGVMFFKEGLGAVGYSRTQWSWSAARDTA